MKVRMFAVLSILALAAWRPLQAQQAAAPAEQSSRSATPKDSSKADNSGGCCDARCAADPAGKDCCPGQAAAKGPSCCSRKAEDEKSAASRCQGMKDGQCAAKNGKSGCEKRNAGNPKGCCAGLEDQGPSHASGK